MKNRNSNIDLLRVFTMSLVTCIHFLCYNGLWVNNEMPTYNRVFCDVIICLSYCFVNLFVMISGYLLVSKDFDFRRIINTWAIIWVCSVTTGFFVCCIDAGVFSINGLIRTIFPLLTASYWYIVSYFLLLYISPIINKLIIHNEERLVRRALVMVGVLVLVFFNINPLINTKEFLGGSSALPWFCFMYAVGAYIQKYGIKKWSFVKYAGVLSFIFLFAFKTYNVTLPERMIIIDSSSLFAFILSLLIFALFIRSKTPIIANTRMQCILQYLGKCSLCVYIIQENYFFRQWYWDLLNPLQYKDSVMLIGAWGVTVVVFWVLATIVYKIYEVLNRVVLAKITNNLCMRIESGWLQ